MDKKNTYISHEDLTSFEEITAWCLDNNIFNVDDLKHDLKIAEGLEEYELCNAILKTIEKYERNNLHI